MSLLACRINGIATEQLAVADRACQYGDGLFETLAVRKGKVEFLAEHLQRLAEGAGRLNIPMPDEARWRSDIAGVLVGRQQAVLKLVLSRGMGGRGYQAPAEPSATRMVMLSPWPVYPPEYAERGVRVRLCETRLARQPQLAGLKHLNRLEQILARNEWNNDDIQEGLMRDTDDNLIEGTMSNLFVLKGDALQTPDLSGCGVQGIMRQQVIELAPELGLSVDYTDLQTDALYDADALFLTNSLIGIWPISQLEDKQFEPNRRIKQLQERLDALRWQHAQSDI